MELEEERRIRGWAERRRLPAGCLARWLALAEENRRALLQLGEELHLRAGQFLTIFGLFDEIGVREGLSIASILALPEPARILSAGGSGPGRAAQLLETLRAIRFPRMHRARMLAAAKVKELKLPANIRVSWPTDLSSGEVKLELVARGSEELAMALDALVARRTALCELADALG